MAGEKAIEFLRNSHLASGTTFATLQPDNATGNFTKIAQRLPVKIVLAPNQPTARLLRIGLSVEATIETGLTNDGPGRVPLCKSERKLTSWDSNLGGRICCDCEPFPGAAETALVGAEYGHNDQPNAKRRTPNAETPNASRLTIASGVDGLATAALRSI